MKWRTRELRFQHAFSHEQLNCQSKTYERKPGCFCVRLGWLSVLWSGSCCAGASSLCGAPAGRTQQAPQRMDTPITTDKSCSRSSMPPRELISPPSRQAPLRTNSLGGQRSQTYGGFFSFFLVDRDRIQDEDVWREDARIPLHVWHCSAVQDQAWPPPTQMKQLLQSFNFTHFKKLSYCLPFELLMKWKKKTQSLQTGHLKMSLTCPEILNRA